MDSAKLLAALEPLGTTTENQDFDNPSLQLEETRGSKESKTPDENKNPESNEKTESLRSKSNDLETQNPTLQAMAGAGGNQNLKAALEMLMSTMAKNNSNSASGSGSPQPPTLTDNQSTRNF